MFNDSLSDHFKEQTRLAVAAERERCAKIVEGQVFKERYREWPWWSTGSNRSNDSELVKFCDAAAAAIRNSEE